jgi:hypothetical protein
VLETNIVVIDNRIPQISLAHMRLFRAVSTARSRVYSRAYSSLARAGGGCFFVSLERSRRRKQRKVKK